MLPGRSTPIGEADAMYTKTEKPRAPTGPNSIQWRVVESGGRALAVHLHPSKAKCVPLKAGTSLRVPSAHGSRLSFDSHRRCGFVTQPSGAVRPSGAAHPIASSSQHHISRETAPPSPSSVSTPHNRTEKCRFTCNVLIWRARHTEAQAESRARYQQGTPIFWPSMLQLQ